MALVDRLILDDAFRDKPPSVLYKYLSPDRIDVLSHCQIRLSQPGAFNDPFEGHPRCLVDWCDPDYIREKFPDWILKPDFIHGIHAKLGRDGGLKGGWTLDRMTADPDGALQHVFGFLRSAPRRPTPSYPNPCDLIDFLIGIISFSETYDDLLMWSHYACSHQGLVVGFYTASELFTSSKFGIRQVQYSNVRPVLHNDDVWKLSFNLVKSLAWQYEREWRLIDKIPAPKPNQKTDSLDYPLMLTSFDPSAIACVLLGARMSPLNKSIVLQTLASTAFQHVTLKYVFFDADKFAVNIVDRNAL